MKWRVCARRSLAETQAADRISILMTPCRQHAAASPCTPAALFLPVMVLWQHTTVARRRHDDQAKREATSGVGMRDGQVRGGLPADGRTMTHEHAPAG